MSIGVTQLILIMVIGILLFGNIPKIFKDVGTGIQVFKKQAYNSGSLEDKAAVKRSLIESNTESHNQDAEGLKGKNAVADSSFSKK